MIVLIFNLFLCWILAMAFFRQDSDDRLREATSGKLFLVLGGSYIALYLLQRVAL